MIDTRCFRGLQIWKLSSRMSSDVVAWLSAELWRSRVATKFCHCKSQTVLLASGGGTRIEFGRSVTERAIARFAAAIKSRKNLVGKNLRLAWNHLKRLNYFLGQSAIFSQQEEELKSYRGRNLFTLNYLLKINLSSSARSAKKSWTGHCRANALSHTFSVLFIYLSL